MSDDEAASRCKVCGQPSTVHLTQVHIGMLGRQRKEEVHYCEKHAIAAGLPVGRGRPGAVPPTAEGR